MLLCILPLYHQGIALPLPPPPLILPHFKSHLYFFHLLGENYYSSCLFSQNSYPSVLFICTLTWYIYMRLRTVHCLFQLACTHSIVCLVELTEMSCW